MAASFLSPISLVQKFDELVPLFGTDQINNDVCSKLQPLIQAESSAAPAIQSEATPAVIAEAKRHDPYALRRCIECHAHRSFETAPYIPFDNPTALRSALLASDGTLFKEIRRRIRLDTPDYERMPKGPVGLLPEQSTELIRYLENIAK